MNAPNILSAHLRLSERADDWASTMRSDRLSVLDVLRARREKIRRQRDTSVYSSDWTPRQAHDSLKSGRLRAFDAAIALLEAAEDEP